MVSTWFLVLAILAIAIQGFLLFLALFEPGLEYKIRESPPQDPDEFLRILGVLSDAQLQGGNRIEVLANGEVFYERELEAIRAARSHVHLEAYIFQKGEIAGRFLDALAERARAGVRVRVVLDAVGSFNTWKSTVRKLRAAGGRVEWFQSFRWYHLARLNNRTHRELLIVDGSVAFLGGAGIADHWGKPKRRMPRWRDSMFQVEGPVVANLQATFAENWLESAGEVLVAQDYFPRLEPRGNVRALVVNSIPSTARAARSRILYQALVACALRSIQITTPYFLPDRSARRELVRAIRNRGVEIKILVPGKHHDHLLTRRSSRRVYGELLKAGARIFEYKPSMMHAKTMTVDGTWSVVGSTNFDHRSFGLNHEVNLAARDSELAARIEQDFARDVAESCEITYEEWRRRPLLERINESLGWLLERQE